MVYNAPMTKAEAKRFFGSYNKIAQILELHRSSVGRWGRMVPAKHRHALLTAAAMRGMERSLGGKS
jgi:hypothetical protein